MSGQIIPTETNTGEKPFSCHICQKSFTEGRSLKSHMTTHSGEKPYKCQICKLTFSEVGNLKVHTRIHSSERPYNCTLCKKTFAQVDHLNVHKRIHAGEKPYKCQICEKSFTYPSQLKQHLGMYSRENHLETHMRIEKPFICFYCQKSFARRYHLKLHMKIHAHDKPYIKPSICQVCEQPFAVVGSLMIQMCAHAEAEPFKCNATNEEFAQFENPMKYIIHATEQQPISSEPHAESISSTKEFTFCAGTEPVVIKTKREDIDNLSDSSLKDVGYWDSIGNESPDSSRAECLYKRKLESTWHLETSLSKSFGCGLCDEIVEVENYFLEHCSLHEFSPPHELMDDLYSSFVTDETASGGFHWRPTNRILLDSSSVKTQCHAESKSL